MEQPEASTSQHQHWPDAVIKHIAAYVAKGPERTALLHLLAMCGVSSHWRNVARHLDTDTTLRFDSLDAFAVPLSQHEAKFRRSSAAAKTACFSQAAATFSGYSRVALHGEGVSDAALTHLAARVGSQLTACSITSAAQVTDTGVSALVRASPKLRELRLSGLPKLTGACLAAIWQSCPSLERLQLENLPVCDWGCELRHSMPSMPALAHLQRLNLVAVNLQDLSGPGSLLRKAPSLEALALDGPASNLRMAVMFCPRLVEVSYRVPSEFCIDAALHALSLAPTLRSVELTATNFAFSPEQLRCAGRLGVSELRIDSQLYKEQPSVTRTCYSHVDNEGVRALVDSICKRWTAEQGQRPFKLSLCGASSLTHDAVAALLRLPMLTELNIGGCARLTAMDKMRLVAKVKAGREQLECGIGHTRRHRHLLMI